MYMENFGPNYANICASIAQIQAIAEANPEGFTVSVSDAKPVKVGWAVAMEHTQNCFGEVGLLNAVAAAELTTGIVGGWLYNGSYYFDAIMLFESKQAAVAAGIEHKQIGIFNTETLEYVELNAHT